MKGLCPEMFYHGHLHSLWVRIPIRQCVLDTTLCDKACQWLAVGRWFSPGIPISSTNKTDRHDITEILLTVALNTITLPHSLWRMEIKMAFLATHFYYMQYRNHTFFQLTRKAPYKKQFKYSLNFLSASHIRNLLSYSPFECYVHIAYSPALWIMNRYVSCPFYWQQF